MESLSFKIQIITYKLVIGEQNKKVSHWIALKGLKILALGIAQCLYS